MDGGMNGYNVFAVTFQGANISKEAIELKSACVASLIDGTRLDLEIVGSDASGESKLVPINKVQLIAPGAPLELKAKFGPAAPGGVLLAQFFNPEIVYHVIAPYTLPINFCGAGSGLRQRQRRADDRVIGWLDRAKVNPTQCYLRCLPSGRRKRTAQLFLPDGFGWMTRYKPTPWLSRISRHLVATLCRNKCWDFVTAG
jgi:hypothetical protein